MRIATLEHERMTGELMVGDAAAGPKGPVALQIVASAQRFRLIGENDGVRGVDRE